MRAKVLVIYRVTSNFMKIFIKKFSYALGPLIVPVRLVRLEFRVVREAAGISWHG